jgi:hypothetical protein
VSNEASLRDRTIADFGEQWTAYSTNDGYLSLTII